MKFKGIAIGILAAILATNIVTAYMLVKESKKQTAYQHAQYALLDTIADSPDTTRQLHLIEIATILSNELRGKPSLEGVAEIWTKSREP